MTAEDEAAWFDQVYRDGSAPWDIGRPQSVWIRLADQGVFRSPVLDSGCGAGYHSILLAEHGHDVLGIDLSPTAIELARAKAAERGLTAEFVVGDVLDLGGLGRRFATVLDSAVFHVFDAADRVRYVASLADAIEPGGVLYLLCFSDQVPGKAGPYRISQDDLRTSFADGWHIEDIEGAHIDVRDDWALARPHAWLATIVRTPA